MRPTQSPCRLQCMARRAQIMQHGATGAIQAGVDEAVEKHSGIATDVEGLEPTGVEKGAPFRNQAEVAWLKRSG